MYRTYDHDAITPGSRENVHPVCCHLFVLWRLCTSLTLIAMLAGVLYSW